jgi:hypothetical protein
MRFIKTMLSLVLCFGIDGLQAMQMQKQKTTAESKMLREIFVTDGRIKGFLKKHCGLDISEKWQNAIETSGYLDPQISDQKLADFFKDNQLTTEFKLLLEKLIIDIKEAFKKIRRHSNNNSYYYRHAIKCQFLELFDWFVLKKDRGASLHCYNLVERCPQELPESQSLFKKLYSTPASLLDKHPNDRPRNLDEPIKEVEYTLILDGVCHKSLKLSCEEEAWKKADSFIKAIEQSILFHFGPDHFIERLKKGDVSYFSEPLCGFILKQYDVPAAATSEMHSVRYTLKEDHEILPKLFEYHKPEGSKVVQHLGLLGLILAGQVTGPEAQKIAQSRHQYVLREQRQQEIANDKIVFGTFDVPLCETSDQKYTCQGTLSARDAKGTRILDVQCACNPQVLMISDGQETCKVEKDFSSKNMLASKSAMLSESALIPNEYGGNAESLLYKQGENKCTVVQIGKPFVMTIKEDEFHNFDIPSVCTGSLSSNNDVIKELDFVCVEQLYSEKIIENVESFHDDLDRDIIDIIECRNGIDCCATDDCNTVQESSSLVDHIMEVTDLVLNRSKITVNVSDANNARNFRKNGYTVNLFPNKNELIERTQKAINQNPNPQAWMVCHLEGDPSKVDILKEIQHHGNNCDLIMLNNGTVIMRKTHKACEVFQSICTQELSNVTFYRDTSKNK